jgi:UDP:flavonoid glycosyltransferase YjiC (YdhE family)
MARIVINSWGSYGDVNPYLALAVALSERGHEAVMALPEHFRDDVTRLGLPFHPVGGPSTGPRTDAEAGREAHGSAVRHTYLFRDVMMPAP